MLKCSTLNRIKLILINKHTKMSAVATDSCANKIYKPD